MDASRDAAALVVHDLKNELGALEADLEALARAPEPGPAEAAAARCRELRQRFVMYLMVYGGEPLRALVEDESPRDFVEALARRQSRHGGRATLRLSIAEGLPAWAYFDARLVTLALEAALHNARRFARGEITLGLSAVPGRLLFSVDDDGPGPGACAPAGEGDLQATGLGTALCRAVARAHGGTDHDVLLEGRPGGGARFQLAIAT